MKHGKNVLGMIVKFCDYNIREPQQNVSLIISGLSCQNSLFTTNNHVAQF
jgi:hypothetical protein